jgi:hypothetical protein
MADLQNGLARAYGSAVGGVRRRVQKDAIRASGAADA